MNRRGFLWTLAAATCGAAMPRIAQATDKSQTSYLPNLSSRPGLPNIVLVMSDDLGWGDTGYNGHPTVQTPNLDAMAAVSLRFDRFYAAAPSCSPTRGSVMTARHPNRYRCFFANDTLPPEEISIAKLLRQAGYATAHFGKWGLGDVDSSAPTGPAAHGFENFVSSRYGFNWDPWLSSDGDVSQRKGEGSMVLVDAAVDFMRQQVSQRKPFLAVVWFSACHAPHVASSSDTSIYADQPEDVQHFYGEITAMDRAIGKLRADLREMGISKDTLLWFCSDNGGLPDLGRTGGRAWKHWTYEGGLRVPGLLEWPARIPAGRSYDRPVVTSDIMPTLLEIARVETPGDRQIDGISLLPAVDGDPTDHPPIGFWFYQYEDLPWPLPSDIDPSDYGQVAWLDWPWKLHKRLTPDVKTKLTLYNLVEDPYEQFDLAAQQPQRVVDMRQALETWQASVLSSMRGEDYA